MVYKTKVGELNHWNRPENKSEILGTFEHIFRSHVHYMIRMNNTVQKLSTLFSCALLLILPLVSSAQVEADFFAPVTSGCSPLIVNFQNTSTGSGLSYQWNLGNGNNSSSENPSASYIDPGTYTITLTVSNGSGSDTETKTAYVTVFTPPTPDISPSQTVGCYPFTVDFTDLSVPGDSPIATWSWDFGDGGASTDQNPSHTYTTPGDFDITLILTDVNGCSSNQSFPDMITSNSNAPTAEFTGDPTVGCLPPVDVSFTNTSSGGTGTLTYFWDFGDGNTSTVPSPDYTYNASGVYDVTLTVTDDLGCATVLNETEYITIVDNVSIDFVATETTICLGDQLSFVDISSPTPTSWQWDFGDGNTSTDQHPTHLYTTPGTYEVSLTSVYSSSCQGTETKTAYITVAEIPFVDFTADVTAGCETPFPVNFTNNSVGPGPVDYLWSFGDGNNSVDENPSNTYMDHGVYTVNLTATNSSGCSNTLTENGYINIAETTADFLPDVFGFCQPLEVNFEDLSISGTNIVSYEWDFGDGGTSSAQNPTYEYADTGIYDVSLVITNDLGCTDTVVRENYIFVYTPPNADFVDGDTVICPGDLSFTDLSTNATDWFWSFGNAGTSTEQFPVFTFEDTGYYDITLITLNNGCSDTLIVEDMVYVSPGVPGIGTEFDCSDPNTFTFTNESYGITSFVWNLPGGGTSTDDPLTLTFPDPGMYIIGLGIENSTTGCSGGDADTVYVTELEADFSATNTQDCGPLSVQFTDESTDAVFWEWFFGTGAYSQEQSPTYVYDSLSTFTVTHVVTDINGCTDTIVAPDLVTVTGSAVDFGIDTIYGCDTLSVQFTDLSTPPGSITDWLWDFGDGNTSTLQNPLHIYEIAGDFDVTLTVTDVGTCVNTMTQTSVVSYLPYPVPAFTVDTTVGCMGDPFTFTNNSTSGAVNFLWNFGDGNTSVDENPVHIYESEGVYSVTLTAFNINGCDSSITEIQLIDIQHPDAGFTAFPTFAFCPPLLVSFTDVSSADVVSWFWQFGDGSSSSLQNPSHIYTESGVFSVSLVVTNAGGCTDTIDMPDLVTLSGPSGEFDFFPDTVGCPPYDITYTATANNAASYTWDFGDGFLGSGETTTHSYTEIGSYIPTLILEDNNGCTFTYQSQDTLTVQPLAVDAGMSVTICEFDTVQLGASGGDTYSWFPPTGLDDPNSGSPAASPSETTEYVVTIQLGQCQNTDTVTVFVNPGPFANFSTSDVCFGSLTEFNNLSTIDVPDSILSWNWDLDEILSTDTNPTHTYSSPGTYNISLEIESTSGCNGIASGTVTVNPAPSAAFTANDTCLFLPTSFIDQSTVSPGAITNWFWDLGNGSNAFIPNPSLTYPEDSVYSVTLIVTADGGCTDTVIENVEIYPLPEADYSVSNVCLNETTMFSDSTQINSGSVAQWDWDFGDGNGANQQHPSHTYASDGNYVFSLTVVSDHGCEDATSGAVTVHPLPESSFTISSTTTCFVPVTVNLNNTSQGANQFEWDHDNGTNETSFNSLAIFDTVGQYNIQLLVTNQFGCLDSSTQMFEVFPTVVADFESTTPIGCEPWEVEFTNLSVNGINFHWDFSDADGSVNIDPVHIFEEPGSYSVELIAEGLGGCADTIVYTNYVTVWNNPTAMFEYENVPDPITNGTVAFYNISTPHVSSWWDFGDGFTSTNENTTYQYDYYGNKLVTLAIVDANGCVDTVQMYIAVDFFGGLFVPNALIPTDDDPNVRVFSPKGTGLGSYRCMVFDKWGNKLWESTKLENGSPAESWDGTHDGEFVPQGAYVWKIDAIFQSGDIWEGMADRDGKYHEIGTVTLIR